MTEQRQDQLADQMTKFLFEGSPIRGAVLQLENAWQEMTEFQHYPSVVKKMLGQFAAGAVLLASTIKFEGALIVQVKGSGPVSMIVVEVKNGQTLRAMAKCRENADINESMTIQELINVNNQGQCAVILDPVTRQAHEQPYTGVVPLIGNTVSGFLEEYMRSSEQLPTEIRLAADDDKIAGILIQKMPLTGGSMEENSDTDAWDRISQFVKTVKDTELLTLPESEILRRLFWQENLQVLAINPISFKCGCSRERTDDMLRSLGRDELNAILDEKGFIEVRCQFCNRVQRYEKADVDALYS